MHNTPEANRDFQIQWCETNLRYLLGEPDQDNPEVIRKIAYMRSEIARLDKIIFKETAK